MVFLLLTVLLAGGVSSQKWLIPELSDPAYAPLDNITIYTYSIKIYYTPEFEAITPDLEDYVEDLINITNQGYINSNVSLRVKLHCLEKAMIKETYDGNKMIQNFSYMKGTAAELRGSADVAALLVSDLDGYGVSQGFPGSLMSGKTISVTQKDGAKSSFVFQHEIGHNFGLNHNLEIAKPKGEGHGYLISKGKAKTGSNTIMAYSPIGYRNHINYYSNPDIIFPEAGLATGLQGAANSAAVLLQNRKLISNIGDESIACGDTINICPTQPGRPILVGWLADSNSSSPDQCKQTCFADDACDYWLWKDSIRCIGFEIEINLKDNLGYVSAPRTCSFAPKGNGSCPEETGKPEASRLLLNGNQTLENCKNTCKKDANCLYWSLRLDDNKCYLTLIKFSSGPGISGARLCSPTDI